MNELFPVEAVKQDSPRVAWFKKHNIQTYCSGPAEDFDGEPWNAWSGSLEDAVGTSRCQCGATEDEALANLARVLHIKFWNETNASAARAQQINK